MVMAMVWLLGLAAPAPAQEGPAEQDVAGMRPAEVGRLLDAYATMRAQEMLALSDQQYGPFVQQFKRLQEVRRRLQAERGRLIADLQRLTRADANPSEGLLKQALADLASLEARGRDESTRALAALDGVLTLRQQVRFRVFEEMMERRKLELMTRARQTARRGAARR